MFHQSNLGIFGANLPCDRSGYVPEQGDQLNDFNMEFYDSEEKEWWESEEFPAWVDNAVSETEKALAALYKWQNENA